MSFINYIPLFLIIHTLLRCSAIPENDDAGLEKSVPDDDYSYLLAPSSSPSISETHIKAICDKALYPTTCVTSVQSVAPSNLTDPDASTVLKLMVQDTIFMTQAAMDRAKVFAKAPDTDQKTSFILRKRCAYEFALAIDDLQTATTAIEDDDDKLFKSKLEDVLPRFHVCDDEFEKAQLESPMEEFKDKLLQRGENNLSVAKAFWP